MTSCTYSESVSEDVQKVRTPELTNLSRHTTTVDDRSSFVAEDSVYVVGLEWSEFREPYSPWTGVKTAVGIATVLTLFVVYLTVRTQCTSGWQLRAFICVRRAVRSLLPPRYRSVEDDLENQRHSPVIAETTKQCIRRVELELTDVINDERSTCSDHITDVRQTGQPVCDNYVV